jgi:hypothetical protein
MMLIVYPEGRGEISDSATTGRRSEPDRAEVEQAEIRGVSVRRAVHRADPKQRGLAIGRGPGSPGVNGSAESRPA